jgi:N4-gp56 family major capsid protein
MEKKKFFLKMPSLQYFAAGQTGVSNLINPQVMGDMISAELPNALRFAPLADPDYTLQGRPGNTITVPKYGYIGEAVDVAEFAAIPIEQLTTSSTQATIKKAGKGVEISDEAVLSGMGDPIGEGNKQLKMSIAHKVDTDALTALRSGSITAGGATTAIDAAVDAALVAFNEEDLGNTTFVMVNRKGYSKLSKAEGYTRGGDLADRVFMTGQIGDFMGATVVISNRLADGEALVVQPGALGLLMKRSAEVEKDRDIVHKTTIVTADQHYSVYLKDNTKVVKVTYQTT